MISANSTDNKELNKLRLVFEQTPGAIFILDKEFRFEYVNPSFEKLSGYTKEELIGKTVKALFYSEEIHESRREVVEAMLKGEKWQGELLTHNKNGNTYWANTIAAPFKDENGEVEGYIMIQQDVTERKKVENALRESEDKYKTLVENSQDGILIVRNNRVLYANDTLCKLLGYCPEGLTGEDIIHREDIYKVTQIGIRRRNQDFSTINETFRLVAKNGEIKECDTTSTLIKFEGEWCSFFTIHDLTENKRIQLELQKSEQKYRELTEMLPLTVYELDVNNKPTYINKAGRELFGLNSENAGNNAMSFFVTGDRKRMEEVLKQEQQHAETISQPEPSDPAEYTIHKPDGTQIPVLIYGTAIVENEKPIGSRGVIVDISERKAMENELRKSEQKYRELADFLPQTVFELDNKGNLIYVNKAGIEMMGVKASDYGKSVLSFFVPEDHERMRNNLKPTEREKRPNAMNEYLALRADGSTFPVIIYALSVFKNAKAVGTRGIIVDISERKTMENELRKSEQRFRELAEMLPQTVYELDLNANLRYLNKAGREKFGTSYETSEVSVFSIVVPEQLERMKSNFMNVSFNNIPSKGNYYKLKQINGHVFEAMISANPMIVDGKNIGSRGIVVDLTDRIRIENELQSAKTELETLNSQLEKRVKDSSKRLVEARTQLINMQKENLQSQFEVLKQQVNPHFLFNSLNVLTSLIKLEPDLAEKFSEQLSKVYRYVLENKDNELVELNTELNFLEAYIFLLNIRFVGKLNVNVNIPNQNRNDKIIPLAMQLLIENAIKHNVMSKNNPLVIDVFVDNDNNLNIVNNLQERPSQIISTGVGLNNILNRYQLLNLNIPTFEKSSSHFTAKIQLIK